MSKVSKISLAKADKTVKGHSSRVFFEPCAAAKQMRMKKYSDATELKLYLNPRGKTR